MLLSYFVALLLRSEITDRERLTSAEIGNSVVRNLRYLPMYLPRYMYYIYNYKSCSSM